jgi:hypothetical protein
MAAKRVAMPLGLLFYSSFSKDAPFRNAQRIFEDDANK